MPKECAVCRKPAQLAAQITRGTQTVTAYLCESCARRMSEKMPITVIASGVSSLPKGTVLSPDRSDKTAQDPVPRGTNEPEQAPDRTGAAFCGTCGARLQPGSSFCASCGAPAGSYFAPASSQIRQEDSRPQPQTRMPQPNPAPAPMAVPVSEPIPPVSVPQAEPVRKNAKKPKKGVVWALIGAVAVIGVAVVLLHAAGNLPVLAPRPADASDTAGSAEEAERQNDGAVPDSAAEKEVTKTVIIRDDKTEKDASGSHEAAAGSDSAAEEDARKLQEDAGALLSDLGEILSSAAEDAKEAISSADDGSVSGIIDDLIGKAIDSAAEKTDLVIRPAYREAVDSYEAFFDEYIDFMNRYEKSGSPLSMLAEYADYLNRLSDCIEKFAALEDDAANSAETAYFLEAQRRINKKLFPDSEP